jgi:Fur family peroxide stress response transcriptional regulator
MKITEDEIRRRVGRFKSVLKAAGIKMTPQRAEIFREVARTDDHPDAETIFRGVRRRFPSISLDTVYRTLWLLDDLGMVATLGAAQGRTRFDANTDSHHHFVCSRCGATRDFIESSYGSLEIPDSARGFGQVERVHVELRGICLACLKKPKTKRLGAFHHGKENKP